MKDMCLHTNIDVIVDRMKQDRFEKVLEDGQLILSEVYIRLDRIYERQKDIEDTFKKIEGIQYFIQYKLEQEIVR